MKRASLNKRRYRTAAVVPAKGGRAALVKALETVAINEPEGDVALAFVFTGQGAAYAGAVTSLLGMRPSARRMRNPCKLVVHTWTSQT